MDDVEVSLLRHAAGDYDEALGQLCMRCGMVLDKGLRWKSAATGTSVPRGWPAGAAVMATPGGAMLCLEASLDPQRDRSDEADCPSIVEVAAAAKPACWCGHGVEGHRYPDAPGGAGCWSCDCVEYSPAEA